MAKLNRARNNYSVEKRESPKKISWISILTLTLIIGLYIVILGKF